MDGRNYNCDKIYSEERLIKGVRSLASTVGRYPLRRYVWAVLNFFLAVLDPRDGPNVETFWSLLTWFNYTCGGVTLILPTKSGFGPYAPFGTGPIRPSAVPPYICIYAKDGRLEDPYDANIKYKLGSVRVLQARLWEKKRGDKIHKFQFTFTLFVFTFPKRKNAFSFIIICLSRQTLECFSRIIRC